MSLSKIVELQTFDFSYLAPSTGETRTIVADFEMGRYKTGRPIVTVHNANIVEDGTIAFTAQSACPNQGLQFPFGDKQEVEAFGSGTVAGAAKTAAVATMGPAVQITVKGTQPANNPGALVITVTVFWEAWET